MKDKKLLVTGVSGFLGWHICQVGLKNWDVVGTYNQNSVKIAGVKTLPMDLFDGDGIVAFLNDIKPDAVIHAAAMSLPNACELQPELSEIVNFNATRLISEWCGKAGIPMLFTSTDLVFDGEHAPYSEEDAVAPINVYGRHKVLAENALLSNVSDGLVCRMPLMYGYRDGKPASFIGSWFAKMRDGEALTLFTDEFRTIVSGRSAAEGLLLALESGWRGTLHFGGHERISRYEFGLKFAKAFGFSSDVVSAVKIADIKMASPRARNVSLVSNKAFDLGYNPSTIDDDLKIMCNERYL